MTRKCVRGKPDRYSAAVALLAIIGSLALSHCKTLTPQTSTRIPSSPTAAPVAAKPAPTALLPASPSSPTPTDVQPTNTPASGVTPGAPAIPGPTIGATLTFEPPVPTSFPWLAAYDSDISGNDEIYLLRGDGGPPANITNHIAEDRYPAWSRDGTRIAFQSNRDGNWEIYVFHLLEMHLTRLTFDLAYDGAPSWSPDGDWIAFESYRGSARCPNQTSEPDPLVCPKLDIYVISAAGGVPQRVTDSPGGDYQAVWSPDGVWIAFTSWRDGEKEIYLVPADGGPARNFTEHPGDDLSPAWSPDGIFLSFLSDRDGTLELYRQPLNGGSAVRMSFNDLPEERPTWFKDGSLLIARYDPGARFEAHDPYRPGAYHLYRMESLPGRASSLAPLIEARHPAAAPLTGLSGLAAAEPDSNSPIGEIPPAANFPVESPARLELKHLDDIVAPDPRLTSGVDDAFRAWRAAVNVQTGYDFLGRVSDVYRPAAYYGHRLGYLSWHKAGRAVDLLFDWRDAAGENALFIVREDLAGEVYWRLYLKTAVQDGSLGEPLTQAPWYFWWHPDPAKEPATIANGGRRLPIPHGYFVDVTALAGRFGWSRIASYHLPDFHWQRDSTATEYWHYQHTGEMTWYQAMSQVYPQELLDELFSHSAAAARGQTREVMSGKGLPPQNQRQGQGQ